MDYSTVITTLFILSCSIYFYQLGLAGNPQRSHLLSDQSMNTLHLPFSFLVLDVLNFREKG